MKNFTKTKSAGAALFALIASLGISPFAKAQLSLAYEDTTSGHPIGQAYTGPIRINLQDFDMGSLYPSLGAPGTAAGYGASGTGTQTLAGGISTLNALQIAPATGAMAGEDSWGIARIVTITDLAGAVVWSESAKNAQLTVMFYGEQDFYVSQLANGFQEIDGTGLHVDLYLQSKSDPGYTAYNPLPGSSGRGLTPDQYATVTDGTKVLSTVAMGGFIHPAGTLGGLATAFASTFNASSGGQGQTYLSVTGGTDASRFDTNSFTSGFVPGDTADLFAQFTTVINDPAVGDWLVRSNDPVTGLVTTPVPEPSTYGLIGASVLAGLIAIRRRRQNRS